MSNLFTEEEMTEFKSMNFEDGYQFIRSSTFIYKRIPNKHHEILLYIYVYDCNLNLLFGLGDKLGDIRYLKENQEPIICYKPESYKNIYKQILNTIQQDIATRQNK